MARWTDLPMSKGILSLIIAVQDHARAKVSESILFEDAGMMSRVKSSYDEAYRFYAELPKSALGPLTTCRDHFETVYNFKVTDEMMSAEYDDLSRFTFRFFEH